MTLSGPIPVTIPPHQAEHNALALRIQERISAEVLQVAGERVLLSMDGVRLVARLTTPDQSAQLMERRQAQFVVKDMSSEILTLQLVGVGAEEAAAAPVVPVDLIPLLLERAGLPVDEANSLIAQALLGQRMPVTSELVSELLGLLASMGEINLEAAQIAAAMKANGLPLSPDALALALSRTPQLAESLKNLVGSLMSSARNEKTGVTGETLEKALKALQTFFINVSAPPDEVAFQLEYLVSIMGRSLEQRLSEMLQEGVEIFNPTQQSDDLLILVRLHQEMQNRPGCEQVCEDFQKFFDSLRLMHYTNVEPDPTFQQSGWLFMELPFVLDASRLPLLEHSEHTAQLKVAYRMDENGARKIDPRHTRMVISMGISSEDVLAVDLSIVDQSIQAQVSASNQSLQEVAKDELTGFSDGLAKRGYRVVTSQCKVDEDLNMQASFELSAASHSIDFQPTFTKVNLEA